MALYHIDQSDESATQVLIFFFPLEFNSFRQYSKRESPSLLKSFGKITYTRRKQP